MGPEKKRKSSTEEELKISKLKMDGTNGSALVNGDQQISNNSRGPIQSSSNQSSSNQSSANGMNVENGLSQCNEEPLPSTSRSVNNSAPKEDTLIASGSSAQQAADVLDSEDNKMQVEENEIENDEDFQSSEEDSDAIYSNSDIISFDGDMESDGSVDIDPLQSDRDESFDDFTEDFKLSPNLMEDVFLCNLNKGILSNREQLCENYQKNESNSIMTVIDSPFKVGILPNAIQDEQFLIQLENEIEQNITFNSLNNDLFSFQQSEDLKRLPELQYCQKLIKCFQNELCPLLSKMTKLPMYANDIDITVSKYVKNNVLLCHDDMLEDRSIAFILYLVPPKWNPEDGGELYLLSHNEQNEPNLIAKKIRPKRNALLFFEVSPKSYHQVGEVLGNQTRLSINGWFKGPVKHPQSKVIETIQYPIKYRSYYVDEQTFRQWVSPFYLCEDTQKEIRKDFCHESQVYLSNFLNNKMYREVEKQLKRSSGWVWKGPLNRRRYLVLEEKHYKGKLLELLNVLRSEAMFLTLGTMSGLHLHPLMPPDDTSFSDQSPTTDEEDLSSEEEEVFPDKSIKSTDMEKATMEKATIEKGNREDSSEESHDSDFLRSDSSDGDVELSDHDFGEPTTYPNDVRIRINNSSTFNPNKTEQENMDHQDGRPEENDDEEDLEGQQNDQARDTSDQEDMNSVDSTCVNIQTPRDLKSDTSVSEISSPDSPTNYINSRCRVEVRKYIQGCYTLLYDDDRENLDKKSKLDVYLHFNHSKEFRFKNGGFISYVDSTTDDQILTVGPFSNRLSMVYRDEKTKRFMKYLNSDHKRPFFEILIEFED